MADKKGVLSMTGDVTAAQATLFQRAISRGGIARSAARSIMRRRRATSSTRTKTRTKRASSGGSKGGRLKKGSPAAKRRMAALRRMQKK